MKNFLWIILISLVYFTNALSNEMIWEGSVADDKSLKKATWTLNLDKDVLKSIFTMKNKNYYETNKIISKKDNYVVVQSPYDEVGIWEFHYSRDNAYAIFKGKKIDYTPCYSKTEAVEKPKKQQDIMFTIKDKREQCEAIGFKTETEKFADCVLRLVELDIKKQNQNQITSAQSSGNDALVKQLKKQSDLQSSQALINLGQQLMNPKKFNSNIYTPKVQRCTIQGYGSFANMICR
mgnify:CR=1 FL=1